MRSTKLRRSLCLALMAATLALSNAAAAAADEAAVKQGMPLKYPDVRVEAVAKMPIAGPYQAFAGGEVRYVDADLNFMIVKAA